MTIDTATGTVGDADAGDAPTGDADAARDGARDDAARNDDVRDEQGRLVVDAIGMACPKPILELASAIRPLSIDDVVLLLADDPAARVDVPAWARMKRQQVLSLDEIDGAWHIVVAKRTEV